MAQTKKSKKADKELPAYPKSADANKIEGAEKRPELARLPSVWKLARSALALLWSRRRLFLAIVGLHALLSLFFVQSTAGSLNVSSLNALLTGSTDRLMNGVLTYQWILSGAGNGVSTLASVYDGILLLIFSLAIVWALRQVVAGSSFRVRDAFYKGMYPLIPVLAVLAVLVISLLPLIIGLGVFNLVLAFGFADASIAKVLWGIPALALVIIGLLLAVPAVMSLYIATLPDMEPAEALRSGRQLVKFRRWSVLRKLLFLPIALLVVGIVLLIPALLLIPLATPWLVFLYFVVILPIIHAYNYNLYRELLK